MTEKIQYKNKANLVLNVPGDKSISHRSVMFGAISKGLTEIDGFLTGEDCLSTISCFEKMGVQIQRDGTCVKVHGKGMRGLSEPQSELDVGNSGTTIRLMSGILAGLNHTSHVTGDSSIQKRPMGRIIKPLSQMGAQIDCREGGLAPLIIKGGALKGIDYVMPVASAQVKSSILLAGLYAEGCTCVTEPAPTRDHTEIMLNNFGANIVKNGNIIINNPVSELYGGKISVPGDISSAAYFLAAGCICDNSEITVRNVGVNPTRDGIIRALKQMGADISLENVKNVSGELVADITVKSSGLKASQISGDLVPLMIDEIPVLAVCALFAEGTTVIKDAGELKVKESNRIEAMVAELKKFGADIEETDDGMIINGGKPLKGCECLSYGDHRIAMSLAVCALKASGETRIHNAECCNISYPGFFEVWNKL